jgi:hypothetical protein
MIATAPTYRAARPATDDRPGLNPDRLVRLMREAVERCRLDLRGAVVLTEAATGAYAVTPVLAALAGAEQVYAVTRTTRYGTAAEVAENTAALARLAGVNWTVTVETQKRPELVARADIVTNSGHLRPIDAQTVALLKPTAVVPLMYEAWEFRASDVDLRACRRHGVCVAGTDERHPAVGVFSYLGPMAVKLLHDAGVAVYRSNVLVLCDNPFAPFIEAGLQGCGAAVTVRDRLPGRGEGDYDAVLVAARPGPAPVLGESEAAAIAARWPGAVVAQFWGDIDRAALDRVGVPSWPVEAPAPGHMGVLPSAVGPEPIVRLQSGGLKVGELLWRSRLAGATPEQSEAAVEASGFGMRLD